MRKILGLCWLVICGTSVCAEEPARALLEKAIMRAGGEANLKKHQAQTWNEKGTYYGMGEGQPYAGKLAIQFPGQFRMAISAGDMEVFTIVIDKEKGWIKDFTGKVVEMDKDQLKNQRADNQAAWIASLLPLKDKAFKLSMIKGVEVDGKATDGLQVTRADFPDLKLYFDRETSLLAKTEFESFSGEKKKKVMAEIFYSKYKMVDNAQVPSHVVLKHDGKLFVETDILNLKAEGKLEASVFAAPK